MSNSIIKIVLLFLLLAIYSSTSWATITITEDITWNAANSPYIFNDDVVISKGVTLNISHGTVVKFSEGKGLYVNGKLSINGTEESRVIFTALDKHWKGIRIGYKSEDSNDWSSLVDYSILYNNLINGNVPSANIKYLDISKAETAININSSKVSIRKSWIYANLIAINVKGISDVYISSSSILKNVDGIIWNEFENLFVKKGDPYAFIYGYSNLYDSMCSGGGIVIESSFIVNNARDGIYLVFVSDCLLRTILNNTIAGNGRYGLFISDNNYLDVYYSLCRYFDYNQCHECLTNNNPSPECLFYRNYYSCDELQEFCSSLPIDYILVADNIISKNGISNLTNDINYTSSYIEIFNNYLDVKFKDPSNLDFYPVSGNINTTYEYSVKPYEALNMPDIPVGVLYKNYIIDSNIDLYGLVIPEGITLTIKRGITISLASNASIKIKGNLKFGNNQQDASNSLVTFKPIDDSKKWDGIYFINKKNLLIENLNIIGAKNGLSLKNSYGRIKSSRFYSCSKAINLYPPYSDNNESTQVNSCIFNNNYSDIYLDIYDYNSNQNDSKLSILKINNNLFVNSKKSIDLSYVKYQCALNLSIYNNIFYSCDIGLLINTDRLNSNIFNNIFANNHEAIDIYLYGVSTLDQYNIAYNDFFNNVIDISVYKQTFSIPSNNYQVDPLFINSDTRINPEDFRLAPGSPCIDAGKPDMLDRDGTRSDLGIWGGDSDFLVNHAPHQPVNVSPAEGQSLQINNQLCFQTSKFKDDDPGDTHISTRWQLRKQDSSDLLIDIKDQTHLLSYCLEDLPADIVSNLDLDSVYCWKVSYQDDSFNWSPFSQETCFTLHRETTPPEVNIDWPYNTYFDIQKSICLTWNGSDNVQFGLKYFYKIDNQDWQGPITDTQYCFQPHEGNNTFSVKAVDLSGNEKIANISFVVDTQPPSITNISVTNITHNSVTICTTSDEDVDVSIQYGPTPEYLYHTDFSTEYQNQKCITLSNLEGDVTYHYRVIIKDKVGHISKSQDGTFTTPPSPNPEEENPQIEGIFFSSVEFQPQDVLPAGGPLTIKANDTSGLGKAEFYIDGQLQFTDTDPGDGLSWNMDLSSVPKGKHLLEIKVYDIFSKVSTASYEFYHGIPDINISLTPLSGSFFQGDNINVSWIVENNGEMDLPQSARDCIYLSQDDAVSDDDIRLKCVQSPIALAPERSYQRAATVNLSDVAEGEYRLIVATILNGHTVSHATTGSLTVSHRPLPDLSASNLEIGTASVRAGETLTISWQATNHGETATTSTWVDGVWLCADGEINDWRLVTDDKHIGQFDNPASLDVGESYTQSVQVTIPPDISGDYYVVVRLNESGLSEASKKDNIVVSEEPIHIEHVVGPTVVVDDIKITPKEPWPGQEVTVSWRLKNIGDMATGPVTISQGIYLSKDSKVNLDGSDRLLNPNFVEFSGNIAPGEETDPITFTFNSPKDIWGEFLLFVVPELPRDLKKVPGKQTIVLDPGMPSDLALQGFECPSEIQAGNNLHVSWTVTNEANEPTHVADWVDQLIFSKDDSLETVDDNIKVAEIPHSGTLDYGESYTVEEDIFIPQDFATGTYHVFVKVDAKNQVYEATFENNNVNSENVTIQVGFLAPDLKVDSAFMNNQETLAVSPGESVVFNWTVRNVGSGNAPGNWEDSVYLSSGESIEGATVLVRGYHSGSLPGGDSYSVTKGYIFPSSMESGQYTLFFCTDTSKSIIEGNETNNCLSRSLTIQAAAPELVIDNLSVRASDINQGLLDISWHVRNLGGAIETSGWTDKVFLSQDARYDDNDLFLGAVTHEDQLGEHGDYSASLSSVTVPVDQLGNSFILVITDFDQVVSEGNEENNLAYRSTPVPAEEHEECQEGDLSVQSLNVPERAYAGQVIPISWQVANNGSCAVRNWYDSVYLSLDPYLDKGQDIYLGSRLITASTEPGSTVSVSDFPVSIPGNLEGNYYVIIVTDSSNRIFETDEGNNLYVSTSTINITQAPPSDLTVTSISGPDSAYTGDPVEITWSVTNNGENHAVGIWKDAVYLSTDPNLGPEDVKIGEFTHSGDVAPGQSYQAELNSILKGVLPGQYYLIVRTDIRNQVNEGESGEENNVKVSEQTISIDNRPLVLGTTLSKEIGNSDVHYYKIEDVPAGETLKIEAGCASEDSALELFVAHGYVPDEGHFDYVYEKPFWYEQRIVVPETEAGTYYIMVKARNASHAVCTYNISAEIVGFEVYEVSPDHGGNTGFLTVTIKGSKLDTVTSIGLKVADDFVMDDIATIKHASSSELEAVLDLRFIPEGNYSLKISTDSEDISIPFAVIEGGGPNFQAYISGSDRMKVNYFYTYTVNIQNVGLVDAAYSIAIISVPSSFESRIELENAYREDDGETTFYFVEFDEIPVNKNIEIPIQVKGFEAHQKGEIKVWCYEVRMAHGQPRTFKYILNGSIVTFYKRSEEAVDQRLPQARQKFQILHTRTANRQEEIKVYMIKGRDWTYTPFDHTVIAYKDANGKEHYITYVNDIYEKSDILALQNSGLKKGDKYKVRVKLHFKEFNSKEDLIKFFQKNYGLKNINFLSPEATIYVDKDPIKKLKDIVKNGGIEIELTDTLDSKDIQEANKNKVPSDIKSQLQYYDCWTVSAELVANILSFSKDMGIKKLASDFIYHGPDPLKDIDLLVGLGQANNVKNTRSICLAMHSWFDCFIKQDLSPFLNQLKDFLSHLANIFSKYIESLTPDDPNEKSSTLGIGGEHYITRDKPISYTINFENKPTASAPAQRVTIVDKLDPNLDWRTLQLETINFGNVTINVPGHRAFYTGTVELDNGLKARIEVKLDIFTGTLTWVLEAIDPETGELPLDPMLGLLPPNDPETHVGEGYVTFSIRPKKDVKTGTKIVNQATIVFDTNEPLDTNAVFNTIDAGAPESAIDGGSQVTTDPMIHLSWSGHDDENGSGIRTYEIYVSIDDNPYFMWQAVNGTSADYEASPGHTYKFFSVAVDQVGNREASPESPDLTVNVVMQAPNSPEPETGAEEIDPAQLQLSWQPAYQAQSYDLYIWKDGEDRPENPTASGLTDTSFDASNTLDFSTTYRWQVVAHTPAGDVESEVWVFSTKEGSIDADGDGMPDEWEIQYFGTTERDGTGDFDGDGLTDLEEYQSGSDPTASNAPTIPQILAPTDKGEVGDLSPSFTVKNSTDPDGDEIVYDYEIYKDEGLSQLVLSGTQEISAGNETTSWTLSQELTENTWYYWRVRATDGHGYSQWAYGSFFVNVANDAPEGCRIDYPEDGSFIDMVRPTFRVINATDPDGDELRVSFDLFSESSLENQLASSGWIMPGEDGNTTWQVGQDLMEDHEYYLFVTFIDEHGANGTCGPVAFTVNTSNQAPPQPEIVEPLDGSEINSHSVDLVVASSVDPDGDPISYLFQIDTSEGFDSPAIMESGDISPVDGQNTSWHVDGLLENTWYYWRVRASDGMSQSPWSYGKFFVNAENEPPATPNVVNPGDGAEVSDITPVLEVTPVTDPDSDNVTYRFMLYSDSEATQLVAQGEVSEPRWEVPVELTNRTTYYWTCEAVDEHGLAGEAMPLARFVINTGEMIPDHLGLTPETQEVEVGQAFRLTVRVLDSDGQLVEGFNGSVSLSVDQGTINPSTLTGFVNGVWDGQVIIDGVYNRDVTITAQADSGITGETGPITVTCALPLPPERVYPEDNATINKGDITFTWNVREGARSYDIQVASDNETKDVIYEASNITTAFIQVPSSELGDLLQPGETYYWRMRSVGECGSGNWTEPWSFKIPFVEPELTLTYPVGGESVAAGSTVTIEWSYQGDVGDTIKIRYNTGGRRWNTIATGVNVTLGSYDWILPTRLKGRCRIKIESEKKRTIYSVGSYFDIE